MGEGSTQESEPYTAPIDEVYNQVLNAFYEANLAFNVSAKKLTGNKGREYANRLRDSNVLATYLTGKRMQGTWFLLNEKPNTTHTDSAFERAKASQQAKGGTRVQYGGKEYFVRNGDIFDQTGSMVDLGGNAQQVKDIAYIISAYGTNYFGVNQHDGKVLIVDKNGKRGYNRATNKYLSPKEVEELEAILEGRKSKASQTASVSQPPTSLRTIKGQYVTMGTGKPEYHQADMQVLFTTGNNQTFYLAKVDDSYKLIIPNGRSMTIEEAKELISDEEGRTRSNFMEFIQAENVSAIINELLKTSPLENSPYGNSIELKDTPERTPKPDDRMKRGLEAWDRLESLKVTGNTVPDPRQASIDRREKEEKATVAIDTSTRLGRSQLANKKWAEMTKDEKAIITPMFEGMSEEDVQKYWDGTDATQRENYIPACK